MRDIDGEEIGLVSSSTKEVPHIRLNWSIFILLWLIGFEACTVIHILNTQAQLSWIYYIRLLGVGSSIYYTVWYLSIWRKIKSLEEVQRKKFKHLNFYIFTSMFILGYIAVTYFSHTNWFLTNLMNNSLEVNFMKIYPLLIIFSWVIVRFLKKEPNEQKKK